MTQTPPRPRADAPGEPRWTVVVPLGLAAGLLSGMFGVGGGVLIVPMLVLLLGTQQRLAHGTSLAAIIPISAAGVVVYAVHGLVDVGTASFLTVGSVVGSLLGTRLLHALPQRTLRLIFAGLLAATAVRLFFDIPDPDHLSALSAGVAVALVATGLVIGCLSGLLGVGGGIFLVPVLVLLFGFGDDLAKGTSLLMVIPTAIVATVQNVRGGNADLRLAGTIGVAGIATALVGAQLAVYMGSRVSLALFAALLLYSAFRMVRKQN